MIRLRTATGAIGWMLATEAQAETLVASGQWVRADSLDFSRSKFGEPRTPEVPEVPVSGEPVKRGPGRPRKVQE